MSLVKRLLAETEEQTGEPTSDELTQTPKVFVFETLMNQELRKKILGRDVEFEIDFIANWKEVTTNTDDGGTDYHTIIPCPGQKVMGHCLTLTPQELKLFDEWESNYERKVVVLGSGTRSYVYILKKEAMRDYGKNTF